MSVLSAQSIPRTVVDPFVSRSVHAETGMSYGLSACGYDVRLAQDVTLEPGAFALGSTVERFNMPADLVGNCCDKSTLIRQGLLVGNSILEPGWEGWLTVELFNRGGDTLRLIAGQPIAQVIFHALDQATSQPYGNGKYQHQPARPVGPIKEGVR